MSLRARQNGGGKIRNAGGRGGGNGSPGGRGNSGGGVTANAWNPADKDADITLSNSDRTASITANLGAVRGVTGRASGSGIYQFEATVTLDSAHLIGIGNSTATLANFPGSDVNGWGYYGASAGEIYNGVIIQTTGQTYVPSDVIGVVWNAGAGSLQFYKNGVAVGTAITGLTGTMYPMWGPGTGGAGTRTCTINTGQTAFTYPIGGATAWG